MINYEICTDSCELRSFRLNGKMTAEEVFNDYWNDTLHDERVEKSFNTLEDAMIEWNKSYKNHGRTTYNNYAVPFLHCYVAFVRESERDEDGEYIQMNGIHAYSAESYNG